jgi:hypothetical protein
MIAIQESFTFSGLIITFEGESTASEIENLAAYLSNRQKPDQRVRALFDWSRMRACEFHRFASKAKVSWVRSGRSIERAAVVHHHIWNGQAAWLGAALRLGNAEVRSYRNEEFEKALSWLGPATKTRKESY